LLTLPVSLAQAFRLLGEERPDVVIGVGGYASGPIGATAWLRRIPVVIVEPNSYAGLANRLLGRIAKKIVLSFPAEDRQGFFARLKKVNVGPLVRRGIEAGDRTKALRQFGLEPGKFTVFVMGGSGGAHAVNMAMKDAAKLLKTEHPLQILHQTGAKDVDSVKKGYQEAGVPATVLSYISDMAGAYAAADLVVSRSGATTVAELGVCGKQAVLIPYPYAADNHQEHNARSLANRGNVEVIVQKDLTPERLAAVIQARASSARGDAVPMRATAAEEIARLCKDYV
jgi:UDP-N-acetylglucosamine--N-acetylmuramyl-(pentapeptide) pyrophosphoryl-undecaprenol N-acetylglucosamine transferase